MQGRLRESYLSITIETVCAHCQRPMTLTVDSQLASQAAQEDSRPLVFMPDVNWQTFQEPTILDAY